MKIEQAVIFAGGRGERLMPLTNYSPKPMVGVRGKPFMDYLLRTLQDVGIKKVLLLLGYKYHVIENYYNMIGPIGVHIDFSIGKEEDLTGKRLTDAYDHLDDHFLLMYGDNYWPIELEAMITRFQESHSKIQTTVFSNKNGTGEYGKENNVITDGKWALRYDKTRKLRGLNGTDIGYFILEKEVIQNYLLSGRNFSFEIEIVGPMAQLGWLSAYVTDTQYHWITTMDDLTLFERLVQQNNYKPIERRK